MTLKELIEKHGFGVWLALKGDKYFRPLGYSESGSKVIGESSNGYSNWFASDSTDFQLYQAPLKTKSVTMWSPVIKGDNITSVGCYLYATKEEALELRVGYKIIGAAPIQVEVLEHD